MVRIWLIGGTQESADLARELVRLQVPCTVTTTTASARSLYPNSPYLHHWVGCLEATTLPAFLQTESIASILDASHPFAVEISQLAIAASREFHLPYLRYERPSSPAIPDDRSTEKFSPLYVDSFTSLLEGDLLTGRVLLTIGYRFLPLFQPWHTRATLFARILPSVTALETALAAGFTPDHLIALRPPITLELERALWQQWQIDMVVAKASGTPGGETIKHQLAAELGIKLVLISRPEMTYPQQTADRAVALAFCQQVVR